MATAKTATTCGDGWNGNGKLGNWKKTATVITTTESKHGAKKTVTVKTNNENGQKVKSKR